jgi:probable H4MPT-linked C1 transfer pathway protein
MKASYSIGWDIGGAHLKVACIDSNSKVHFVEQIATPLWKGLECLDKSIPIMIKKLPSGTHTHALTMTAELVDVFENREAGLNSLINLCEELIGNDISFYTVQGELLNLNNARNKLEEIASANWYASAVYVASRIDSGLFIDVGSTTTDIIPFSNNKLMHRGHDDQSRLRFDELVYTGVIRTPLMALTQKVPFCGEWQSLAAEHFATTADIYRILECITEEDDLMDTADGKAKNIECSVRRLARMVGTDSNKVEYNDWNKLAEYFEEVHLQSLTRSILRVLSNSDGNKTTIVGAGTGRFLIKKVAQRLNMPYIEFSELCDTESELSDKCNTCAPAVALAQLNRLQK